MNTIKTILIGSIAVLLTIGAVYLYPASPSQSASAFYVIPPAYASIPGGGTFLGPLSSSQRTYQFLIRDSILTGLVGQQITAISLRLTTSAGSNWPTSPVSFTNFDLYLSQSVAPENRSLTFSQNVVGVQKRVRFGLLDVPAGVYPSGGSPTAFGPEITFDSAYLYTGGHLLIELRHTGFTGTSSSTDAILTSTSGYGYLFSACWTGSYSGTSGSQGNFVISRLTASPPVGIVNENEISRDYSLAQNYPNPFNPETSIKFNILKAGKIKLNIYNAAGEYIDALINNVDFNAGTHLFNFDASGFSTGVYFYSLSVNDELIATKKMVLIK